MSKLSIQYISPGQVKDQKMLDAITESVIKGTPRQNSIKPIEEYLVTGAEDLLPKAKNIPIGKQKIKAKIEIINVRESPPQAVVSTHSRPKFPPEIKLIMINGKINNKKIIKYFLNLTGI